MSAPTRPGATEAALSRHAAKIAFRDLKKDLLSPNKQRPCHNSPDQEPQEQARQALELVDPCLPLDVPAGQGRREPPEHQYPLSQDLHLRTARGSGSVTWPAVTNNKWRQSQA